MRTMGFSLEELENFVVDFSIGTDELAGVNGALASGVRGAASCLFNDDSQRSKIPGLGGPIQSGLDRAFGDQHVLPESTERAAVARGVEQASDFCLVGGVFAGPGAGGEHHGVAELIHTGDVKLFPVAVRPFTSISPPARAQTWRADHGGDDFAALLDGYERPKGWNAARKLFRAVDGVNNHSRPLSIGG